MKLTQRSNDMLAKVKELLDDEAAHVYFHRYQSAVDYAEERTKTNLADLATSQDIILVTKFFQKFWEALPDNKSIRVYPFFTVCDLAEFYCEGDFYDE